MAWASAIPGARASAIARNEIPLRRQAMEPPSAPIAIAPQMPSPPSQM